MVIGYVVTGLTGTLTLNMNGDREQNYNIRHITDTETAVPQVGVGHRWV